MTNCALAAALCLSFSAAARGAVSDAQGMATNEDPAPTEAHADSPSAPVWQKEAATDTPEAWPVAAEATAPGVVEAAAETDTPPEAASPEARVPVDEGASKPEVRAEPSGAFGVRLGYLVPGPGRTSDFTGAIVCGLYYRAGREKARLRYEVGVDFSSSRSVDVDAAASQLWARAAGLYYVDGRGAFYLLGGGQVAGELYDDNSHDISGDAVLAAVDLGAGLTFMGGKLDVRATYSFFLGSENVPGAAGMTVGYLF